MATNEIQPRGIGTVRVKKSKVLEQMKANREVHNGIFLEALEGYHKEFLKKIQETLDDAKKNKKFQHYWIIEQPEDHTDEYDAIIQMLELSLDTELILTQQEFRTYMMDDWGWKNNFLNTNSTYSSTAASSLR